MDNHCAICGDYLADTSRMVCPKCEKPCDSCEKVKDPPNCENKLCKEWKAWFLRKWSKIYGYGRRYSCSAKVDGWKKQ